MLLAVIPSHTEDESIMFCGDMILPMLAPIALKTESMAGDKPMPIAALACIGPNSIFADVLDPVMNDPRIPIAVESNGNSDPVTDMMLSAIASVMPE